ncbi:ROK family protein, partial [Klebsiella pneumoniae]|nr:ROK family protein [Klebsiella pneumoniae]
MLNIYITIALASKKENMFMGILVFDFGGSAVKYGCWDS